MRFVEMTGRQLVRVVSDNEMREQDLINAGITSDTIVRVNEHGDIEVRHEHGWDVVGGLLGEYHERIKGITGLDWA
ncbi:MAG: hypothetical protein MUF25_14820 [Pirellulaceae bacterium]|jgi:hypothetical protein|nr:hypothetical protein [Pirellulaceae bacterium]